MIRKHFDRPNFPLARLLALLAVLGLAVWLAAVASAQATTGNLSGQVVDEAGNPIVTAIVTVEGSNLIQPRKAAVDEEGKFFIIAIPPGEYRVSIVDTDGGHAPAQFTTRISLNQVASMGVITLKKALADGAVVAVVDASSTVADPNAQDKGGALNQTNLRNVPSTGENNNGRRYQDYLTLIPGVTNPDESGNPYVHGMEGDKVSTTAGGVTTRDPAGPAKKEEAKRKDARGSAAPAPKQAAPYPSAPPATAAEMAAAGYVGAEPPRDADSFRRQTEAGNTEAYKAITENNFKRVSDDPLSTFSIDVDTASFSNVRRFLGYGQLPPADAVRLEELINYFTYDYAQPTNGRPFAVHVDAARCPWEPQHLLVRIGLKGREVPKNEIPPCNLVFLLDVSGSMQDPNKLPLVIEGLTGLANELRPQDRVAIVVYAGSSGVVLPSTSDKTAVIAALSRLSAGGSTNGAAGIRLAYQIAAENYLEKGVNRVILATDGDFNVGTTSEGDLVSLITEKAKTGVFLNVLGFGMGNVKDSTMEQLADKGNGMYAYIDTAKEARRVLVQQMAGTLYTIAKDVKIQCEFNPSEVAGWRLLGYENRILQHEDFNDDRKDAGEIGAGHTVTALYEIVPFGTSLPGPGVDPLKYQQKRVLEKNNEWLTVKLRYKDPDGSVSKLIEEPFAGPAPELRNASPDLRFAAAVASFGMMLRGSEHRGATSFGDIAAWASTARGADRDGARSEFLQLVQRANELKGSAQVTENR